ncbi:MAG: hypothetical protein HZA32_17235 [Opitutae bacterium]|nr:hypothetical protein [Opitutae bacterium]
MQPTCRRFACLWLITGLFALCAAAREFDEALFAEPPAEAKPRVWMHLMNGNVSAEGLTKDFEALAAAGVGGVILFSVDYGIPAGDVAFNSDRYRALLAHAAHEARRLGLTLGLHNCDGWSSSGGPWIQAEDSMKRLVWSETVVRGGVAQRLRLPQPTTQLGFYREIAVLACPAEESELAARAAVLTLRSSPSVPTLDRLSASDGGQVVALAATEGKAPWIEFAAKAPFTARSLTLEHRSRHATAQLLVSDDGEDFHPVAALDTYRTGKSTGVFTASFAPVTARVFRVVFSRAVELTHAELSTCPRLPDWPARNGMARLAADQLAPLVWPAASHPMPRVLPGLPDHAGNFTVELPAGVWRVLRFGYTTTAATNYPATAAGRGLECDKFDRRALEKHFAAYLDRVTAECGDLAGTTLKYVALDSYEMGGQNWTADLAAQFKLAHGYDLLPYLPLLAGYCQGDATEADAVLRDFQGLLAGLMQRNYYAAFTELCHRRGLQSYIEPYGFGPFDHVTAGGAADIPMAEFWLDLQEGTNFEAAISAAHIYGKPVVSAEAFTSWSDVNWKVHPSRLKFPGDYAWARGVNEFCLHRFAHQANTHVVPGMTMGDIGSQLDRTQTWWPTAGREWLRYVARGSYLLRQGQPVADVLVYPGETSPQPTPTREQLALPAGYNFDLLDTPALLHRLSTRGGRLVFPEGTSYGLLLLRNSAQLSLPVLRRLREFAAAGVPILGDAPTTLSGRAPSSAEREEFAALVAALWAPANVGPRLLPLATSVAERAAQFSHGGLKPDLVVEGAPDAPFAHRRTDDTDLFFVLNPTADARVLRCSFRVAGRRPERWHAETGTIQPLDVFASHGDRTELELALPAHGSAFVVFRREAGSRETASAVPSSVASAATRPPLTLASPWQVTFEPVDAAHWETPFYRLSDWSEDPRPAVRYFSGTAEYRAEFDVPTDWLERGRAVSLDLGRVEISAEVTLNDRPLGLRWCAPYAFDITHWLRPGVNTLRVRVTNLWTNRLIGDNRLPRTDGYAPDAPMPRWYVENQPAPPGTRTTFTTVDFYETETTLLPSGLLGPVTLVQERADPRR